MSSYEGKTAIVTGGAAGIGRALCEELGRRGCVVHVTDINEDGARTVAEGIIEKGGSAYSARLDVKRNEEVENVIAEAADMQGRVDYMFNNAGIAVGGELRHLSLEDWRPIIDINLIGVLHGAMAAYHLMVRQGFGHIVNVASVAGLAGCPLMTPYAATKHAVVGFSNSNRAEASGLGIKVSVVCPGFIQTSIYDSATLRNATIDQIMPKIPFKKMNAEGAAQRTLKGIERNEDIIVFPLHARILWHMYRLWPGLLNFLGRKMVRDYRRAISEN